MKTSVEKTTGNQGTDPTASAARFARRLLAGDCERLVDEFYAEGARMVPPGYYPIVGRDPIRRHWKAVVAAGLTLAEYRLSGVEPAGAEAIGLGRYAFSFEGGLHESGAFFIRYRREHDGSWKAVEHVFHSDTAA